MNTDPELRKATALAKYRQQLAEANRILAQGSQLREENGMLDKIAKIASSVLLAAGATTLSALVIRAIGTYVLRAFPVTMECYNPWSAGLAVTMAFGLFCFVVYGVYCFLYN